METNHVDNFRYERKFVISGFYNRELQALVKLHPALFSEVYYQRQVNNIYFDTFNFRNFTDNVSGSAHRTKTRIRWYGDLFGSIEKPVLEYKIKNSFLGKKDSYKLQSFTLDEGFNSAIISDLIGRSSLPARITEDFKSLHPVLLNLYKRSYYLSADQSFRITIDTGMEYFNIRDHNNFFVQKYRDQHTTIIELKYNAKNDDRAHQIASKFPFRMTKSSKYINGVNYFFKTKF